MIYKKAYKYYIHLFKAYKLEFKKFLYEAYYNILYTLGIPPEDQWKCWQFVLNITPHVLMHSFKQSVFEVNRKRKRYLMLTNKHFTIEFSSYDYRICYYLHLIVLVLYLLFIKCIILHFSWINGFIRRNGQVMLNIWFCYF